MVSCLWEKDTEVFPDETACHLALAFNYPSQKKPQKNKKTKKKKKKEEEEAAETRWVNLIIVVTE